MKVVFNSENLWSFFVFVSLFVYGLSVENDGYQTNVYGITIYSIGAAGFWYAKQWEIIRRAQSEM